MFVISYQYFIHPDKTKQCLRIQKQAKQLYNRYGHSKAVFLQNQEVPVQRTEIQWYNDVETYHKGINRVISDSEMDELWEKFKECLDPANPTIKEIKYEQLLFEDNLM